MHNALTIALTGGIGSGKSTLGRMLVEQGAALIDTDAIAHELTAAGGAAIGALRAEFGDEAIGPDGALDRCAVRARVFADPRSRQRLEALLHPMIWQRAGQLAGALAATAAYLVFDVPLLTESATRAQDFDRVLVVDCPVALQVARVVRRGSLDRAEVEAIVAAQASREQRLALADDVVFNGESLEALAQRALRLHSLYASLASGRRAV
ncbi:MAG: dephospho-CoA kinase [Betaproteobacteria bacterium]|nr:MAG: dephospho-CoA kinase [Betaproteobacteria bacterium]